MPQEEPIYLVMDNAGGHGTVDAKVQYTEALQGHNVTIVWQAPRSPETNMLDLGIWMSIQAIQEQINRNNVLSAHLVFFYQDLDDTLLFFSSQTWYVC